MQTPTSKPLLRIASGAAALAACALALAQSPDTQAFEPLDSVRAAAEKHLAAQANQTTGTFHAEATHLDPRLRLARCGGELEAFLPPGATVAARTTVGVKCTTGSTWTVYVPVSVESEIPVLVLQQAAVRGAKLTENQVKLETRRVPGFPTKYVGSTAALAGMHLKLPLGPGTPLTADVLVPDVLVRRGQQVTLVAQVGGIEVRARGQALGNASATGRVKVQNIGSQRVVEGTVESADLVRVGP